MGSHKENIKHKTSWQANLQSDNSLRTKKIIDWDFRDKKVIDTFWFSDVHLGHFACDIELFRDNINRVLKNQMPCVDLGDLIENATKDSVGAGVYEQNEIAEEQMEKAVELYKPISHLLKSMQPGNHELRTFDKSGVNLTRIMARELGVPYAGAGVVHQIRVGNQKYLGYSTHGGSGATTVGGKLNALLRMGNVFDADFYIQGHLHDCIYQSRESFELDRRGMLRSRTRHFINNGSYLNYWNTYGQVKGYSPGTKGNTQIRFRGDKHEIEVSFV